MIPWTKEVALAAARLEAAGHEAFLVGGSLRDALLGKAPKDYDLATDAAPGEVVRIFAPFRVIETGLRHGTVTVLVGEVPIEITSYRTDGAYSDGRRPDTVRLVGDIREDLARRDFTINAMAYHPARGLLDPFGGEADLRAGLIRCVGEPARRFGEDGLRILRALRFAAVLAFSIEESTRAALFSCKEMLEKVSAERLAAELTGLLCGKAAERVLLDGVDILGVVIPELLPMKDCPQNTPYHCYDVLTHTAKALSHVPPEALLRWSVLLHDIAKPLCHEADAAGISHFYGHAKKGGEMTRAILQRLRFDKTTTEQAALLVALHDLQIAPAPRQVRRALGRMPPPLFFALLEIKRADTLAQAPACFARLPEYRRLWALAHTLLKEEGVFTRAKLAVNGNDLRARGLQGKEIGRGLQILLEAVLEEQVENEAAALLTYLEEERNLSRE